jgi:hypothetical protein
MKRVALSVFAWYFLMAGKGGSFAPTIFMVVGPFSTRESCAHIAEWVRPDAHRVSTCWEVN